MFGCSTDWVSLEHISSVLQVSVPNVECKTKNQFQQNIQITTWLD